MRFTSESLLPLSPLDQIAPKIYVRSIFALNTSEGYDSVTTQEHLRGCFHKALARWPFLAGQIRPAATGRNRLELAYTLDDKALDLGRRLDLFCCDRINQLGGHTYQELVALGMPPVAMDKDILSLSPNHPKPGESCPPVTLKVTEMTGGGLFVCFSTHHGIFDGGFIKTFLEYFGKIAQEESMKSCLLPEPAIEMQPTWLTELKARPSFSVYENTDIKGAEFPEYDFIDNKEAPSSATTKTKAPRAVCKLFSFNNAILKNIQTEALQYLRDTYGSTAFVSMADTLSAMVWVHVTRSRLPHLSPFDDTNFTTAADARPRLSPSFPATAWGNIYTQTMAGDQVGNLTQLQENGELPSDARPAIFEAAWLIRQAVEKVKQPGYISSRIALAASHEDPAMEGAAFRKANQPDHAGLGCSVWVHMGADIDFRIPGTGGKAEFVRKTYSANDGSMNIMQRRGITKGDAPWDVLLALRKDDMDRVCDEAELGQWTQDWCPRD
ncbi:trichothecene 3-o-acetyltransferase [Colletotrichum kahawae]|uniref:Trichothecene 3-o-acetyltransferase n=1 Tax=Colletotrichum kahawae TaxID=34407 RepID=A0AAD9YPE2_COLKA|nr:trichothecene 3-o-acetyltransferase [Colletotrichum kahawae]